MNRGVKKYKLQLERSRAWKQSHPTRHAELARAYRRRNPEKLKAQNQLNYAIRMGELKRQRCEGCGTKRRVHAHHHDYAKPLDVRWLCYMCHKKVHPVTEDNKKIKFSGAHHSNDRGVDNANAKLTDARVRDIRAMLERGISQERIAIACRVHQTTVSKIKLGKRWSHVK